MERINLAYSVSLATHMQNWDVIKYNVSLATHMQNWGAIKHLSTHNPAQREGSVRPGNRTRETDHSYLILIPLASSPQQLKI